MNKLPTCCEFHHKVECGQGDNCPLRATCAITAFYEQTEGVMPMATGCSVKALPDPARQPLPPIEPPPIDRKDRVLHLAEWLALTAAILFTAAASAGFFTH